MDFEKLAEDYKLRFLKEDTQYWRYNGDQRPETVLVTYVDSELQNEQVDTGDLKSPGTILVAGFWVGAESGCIFIAREVMGDSSDVRGVLCIPTCSIKSFKRLKTDL